MAQFSLRRPVAAAAEQRCLPRGQSLGPREREREREQIEVDDTDECILHSVLSEILCCCCWELEFISCHKKRGCKCSWLDHGPGYESSSSYCNFPVRMHERLAGQCRSLSCCCVATTTFDLGAYNYSSSSSSMCQFLQWNVQCSHPSLG